MYCICLRIGTIGIALRCGAFSLSLSLCALCSVLCALCSVLCCAVLC